MDETKELTPKTKRFYQKYPGLVPFLILAITSFINFTYLFLYDKLTAIHGPFMDNIMNIPIMIIPLFSLYIVIVFIKRLIKKQRPIKYYVWGLVVIGLIILIMGIIMWQVGKLPG